MQGFRLGSIFDFEIRVDLSWFIIFFLVLWTLSFNLFPANYPGLSGGTYFAMGATGTILFFVSLLIHELSHSFIARMKGIPVEGITLFAFGGVSRTRLDAENPGDEFQIAGVGPLMSVVLSVLFASLWWIGVNLGWSVAVTGVVAYLSFINLLLAGFNLLPGFPLDGGRLFRSIVWKVTDNLKRATRIASAGGRLLGFGLIAFGIWQLFGPNLIGGLWLILIGWFLNNSAETSYQDLLIRTSLEGVPARELMTTEPETVPSDLKLQDLVDEYFLKGRHQAYPVLEENRPVGIITLNQVKQTPREDWATRTVKETMMPIGEGIAVNPDEKMTEVLEKIEESGMRRMLVTQEGALAGIISASDVARWLRRRWTLGESPSEEEQKLEQKLTEESA
jgi:Zn-dependent protease